MFKLQFTISSLFFFILGLQTSCVHRQNIPNANKPIAIQQANDLLSKSDSLFHIRAFDLAIKTATEAKKIYSISLDSSLIKIASCDFMIVRCLWDKGNHQKAFLLLEKVLEIQKNNLSEHSEDLAESYFFMGLMQKSKSLNNEALENYDKALLIYSAIDASEMVAQIHNNKANIFKQTEKYELALAHHDIALSLRKELFGEKSWQVAQSYSNIGNVYKNKSRYDLAIQYHKKALAIYKSIYEDDNIQTSITYYGLGYNLCQNGNYDIGILYLEKSLLTRQRILGMEHSGLMLNYSSLGLMYYNKKQYAKALDCYQKSIALESKFYDKTHNYIVSSNSFIGVILGELGLFEEANEQHSIAVKNALSAKEIDKNIESGLYNNWGNTYTLQGDSLNALINFRKALEIRLELLGEYHHQTASTFTDIGVVYKNNHELESAVIYFERSMKSLGYYEDNNFSNVSSKPLLTIVFKLLAELYIEWFKQNGNPDFLLKNKKILEQGASLLTYRADKMNTSLLNEIITDTHDLSKLSIQNIILLSNYNNDLEYKKKAFAYSELSKSLLLRKAIYDANVVSFAGISQEILAEEKDLRYEITSRENKKQDLIKQGVGLLDSTILVINGQLLELNQSYEVLKKLLKTKYPKYYKSNYDLSTTSIEEIQDTLLQKDQTLIEYFVGDSTIYLFLIKQDDYQIVEIKRDFELDSLVKQFRHGMYDYFSKPLSEQTDVLYVRSTEAYIDAARKLYDYLLAPVANKLTESLLIVPDDVLYYISFESLLTEHVKNFNEIETYPFLLKKHTISYSYSATLLDNMKSNKQMNKVNPEGMLLAFAPFENKGYQYIQDLIADEIIQNASDTMDNTINRNDFFPLLSSGLEGAYGVQKWGGELKLGKDATEGLFKKLAPNFSILHLVTHAHADNNNGGNSFVAFTEIPDSIENELLYVRELYNMELHADLVILSACETGIGELERGEGVISLARAFIYSGAKSIVSTLWLADDTSSKDLMINFHDLLKKDHFIDLALKNAKLKYIKDHPGIRSHPFYWAAFLAIGDMGALGDTQ